MLLTFKPPASVFSTVCPLVETVALLFVCHKLAVVCHFVVVDVEPEAFHVVIGPLTMVNFARRPALLAEASDPIFFPLTFVNCSICVRVFTLSMFPAFFVVSFVSGSTGEVLYAVTMLLIILPLA